MAKTQLEGGPVSEQSPTEPQRVVVLTKPGDMLLIGNVSSISGLTSDKVKAATELFAALEIKVIFFADDIDIAKLPADA